MSTIRGQISLISSSDEFRSAFSDLAEKAQQIWVVTAWATTGVPIDLLAESGVQLQSIVGTSFNATHPDALGVLMRLGPVYVDPSSNFGIFHPKLYLFKLRGRQVRHVVILGSPNLTHAAFTANEEVAVQVILERASASSLLKYIASLRASPRLRLTPLWLRRYRRRYASRGAIGKRIAKVEGPPRADSRAGGPIRPLGTLIAADWDEYQVRLDAGPNNVLEAMLSLRSTAAILKRLRS